VRNTYLNVKNTSLILFIYFAWCNSPCQVFQKTAFNFKGLANPGRLHGEVSMSTNVTGFRAHRSPQHLEMDLAWQELMAITDLQVGTLEHPTRFLFYMHKHHNSRKYRIILR